MKRIKETLLPILAILVLFSITSCDKEEESVEDDKHKLIEGTWLLYAAGQDDNNDGQDDNNDGQISDDERVPVEEGRILELTLSADGNGSIYENYTDEGETITPFKWKWSGDSTIILTNTQGANESILVNVLMLTDSELGVYGGIDDSNMILLFKKKV